MEGIGDNEPRTRRVALGTIAVRVATVVGLAALLVFPILGSQVYFRHDDATLLQWAASYRGSLLDVFSPTPAVNGWGLYRGMDVYYRPTVYVIVLQLVRTFGLRADILMGLAGGGMALTLATYLWVLKRRWHGVAVVALGTVGVLYGGLLYQSFRLATSYPYLFEMLAIALAVSAMRVKGWGWRRNALVAGTVVAYLMSSARQSALVLVPAVLVLWYLFAERGEAPKMATWRTRVVSVSSALVGVLLLAMTALPGGALGGLVERMSTAFWFYWDVATGGPRLAIVLAGLGYVAARALLSSDAGPVPRARAWQVAAVVLGSLAGLAAPVVAVWMLLVLSVVAARRRPEIVIGMGWYWFGLAVFLVPDYYHQAYLLEAVLGLSLALALCWVEIGRDAVGVARRWWGSAARRARTAAVAVAVVAVVVVGALGAPKAVKTARRGLTTVAAFVDVNKSAEAMIAYVAHDLPSGSAVLALTEEQLGRSRETWRNESLEYRASQVRVMDVKDVKAMVAALGGRVRVLELSPPDEVPGSQAYGVVYAPGEIEAFEESWDTREAADFSRGQSYCKLLALEPK